MRLEELIKKREQELRIIKNTLGLGFPLVEERKMLRISFLELELADLYILRYEQPQLNENQQIVLKEIKDISQECDYNLLGIIWVLGQRAKHDTDISRFTNNEILQVLQAFSACALEQEEE